MIRVGKTETATLRNLKVGKLKYIYKMNKNLFLICVAIFNSILSFGQNFTNGGINYQVTSSTTVMVAGTPFATGNVIIPNNVIYNSINYLVTDIYYQAFNNCTSLTSVNIPNSVTNIGQQAFSNCASLTSVNIPSSVTNISSGLFVGCLSLTSINIPSSVTNIGGGAFQQCSSLTSVTIPNSVTNIGSSAFFYCTNLTSVNIPNSVTNIGDETFRNCTNLTSINIPNSVTNIGIGAFYNCSSLTSFNIPNSVTNIGQQAFNNCTSLTSVLVNWTTPLPINSSAFGNLNLANIVLIVPTGTTTLYEATPVWTDFNIQTTLGNNELELKNNKLIIYPNPTSNYITIQNKEYSTEKFDYKLLDLTGKIVKIGNLTFDEKINIESLTSGYYVIKIETENKEKFTEKLLKN